MGYPFGWITCKIEILLELLNGGRFDLCWKKERRKLICNDWEFMVDSLYFCNFFNTGYPYDTLLPICNDIVKWALHVMVTVTGFLQHKSNKYECCAFHAEATWSNIATMIQNTPLMKTYSEALLEWNLHIVIYVVLVAYWLSTLTSIWNISVLLLFIRSFVVSTILIDIRMWLLNIGAGK